MSGTIGIRLKVDAAVKATLEGSKQSGVDATNKVRASLEALSSGDVTGKFADQLTAAAIKIAAAQKAVADVPVGLGDSCMSNLSCLSRQGHRSIFVMYGIVLVLLWLLILALVIWLNQSVNRYRHSLTLRALAELDREMDEKRHDW